MVQANRNTTHKNAVSKDEQAVSAIVGVILMIAVTVILAAVVGAFVFNYTPNLLPAQGATPIGFKFDNASKTLTIVNNGGMQASNILVKANGYQLVEGTGYKLIDESEYATVPATDAAASAPLNTVGGMVKLKTAVDETHTLVKGMTITVTGEVNGGRVVLATYTMP